MSTETVDAKVVFLGGSGVGKTSIICRAISDDFNPNMASTIGACFAAKRVQLDSRSVNLQIWDTAGQERFRTLAPMYYRGAVVCVLVFSVIDDASLLEVEGWAKEMSSQASTVPELFVVGNKVDCTAERTVQHSEGEAIAQKLKAGYLEVSAKKSTAIDELFVMVAELAAQKVLGVRNIGETVSIAQVIEEESGPKKKKFFC
jgi:small GTP-binding protein